MSIHQSSDAVGLLVFSSYLEVERNALNINNQELCFNIKEFIASDSSELFWFLSNGFILNYFLWHLR